MAASALPNLAIDTNLDKTVARQDPYRPLSGQKYQDYSDAFLRAVDRALRVDEHERPQSVVDFHRAQQRNYPNGAKYSGAMSGRHAKGWAC